MEKNNAEIKLQVGVKILINNKEGKFLLIRRNPEKYPGQIDLWDIPGGRINTGSSLFENLKREVKEETGLDIDQNPKLLVAQEISDDNGKRYIVRLTYLGHSDNENVQLSEEHEQSGWFSLEELKTLNGLDKYLHQFLEENNYKI